MKIHFVCSGNTNRSRMAEAYLNSKKLPGYSATSSGIYAEDNINGALSRYAQTVLTEEKLIDFTAPHWTQTTCELLEVNDVIVFMRQHHFDYCVDALGWRPGDYRIWNIDDVPTNLLKDSDQTAKIKTQADETIFSTIKKNVDQLIQELSYEASNQEREADI